MAARALPPIGQNLVRIRKLRGFTQDDLAATAGVAISSLKDIERGVSDGSIRTHVALAGALGVALADLLTDPSAPTPVPLAPASGFADAASVLLALDACSDVRRSVLLAILHDDLSIVGKWPELVPVVDALKKAT